MQIIRALRMKDSNCLAAYRGLFFYRSPESNHGKDRGYFEVAERDFGEICFPRSARPTVRHWRSRSLCPLLWRRVTLGIACGELAGVAYAFFRDALASVTTFWITSKRKVCGICFGLGR